MNFNWFAHILVHHPFVILIAVAVFSGTCLVIPFTLKALPDFSDPQMVCQQKNCIGVRSHTNEIFYLQGFETRGTTLASRITAWKNLEEATRPSGPFAVNPKEFLERKTNRDYAKKKIGKNKSSKLRNIKPDVCNKVHVLF